MLPFSREQFFQLFADYNQAIWPSQVAFYLLGILAVWLVLVPRPSASRVVGGILALMWLWTGVAYHGLFFSSINKAAYGFAGIFVIEGIWLAALAVGARPLAYSFASGPKQWLGLGLIVYAILVYPVIGVATGHAFATQPIFGVTPCPVTIFTFGMLLLATGLPSRWLVAIPFVWSLIGGSAALLLGVPQDWVLLAAGLLATPVLVLSGRSSSVAA